jgi:hypothetical protein
MRAHSWVLMFALTAASAAQTPPERLAVYDVRAELRDATTAEIAITLRLDGQAPPNLRLLLVRYPEQKIIGFAIRDAQGQPIAATMDEQAQTIAIRDIRAGAGQEVHLIYMVTDGERLRRIPLAVPSIVPAPATQQRAVRITVVLPPGFVAVGSGFPALAWQGPVGSTELAAIPSAVLINARPQDGVTLADRWLTRETLSTSAMVVLLLIGTGLWVARNRSAWTATEAGR